MSSSFHPGIRLLLIASICAIFVLLTCSIEEITSLNRPDCRSYPLIFFPAAFIRSRDALRRVSSSIMSEMVFERYELAMMISTCSSSSSCGVVNLLVASSKSLYPFDTRYLRASQRLSPATILYSPFSHGAYTSSRFCFKPDRRMSPASSSMSATL